MYELERIFVYIMKSLFSTAYNIKIKIRLGGISKIFCFCSHANMAASDKSISLKRKFLKKFLLKVVDSCWISSTEWSDSFRIFFVYGKK